MPQSQIHQTNVIQKMSKVKSQHAVSNKDVEFENYVTSGALIVIDKDEVYSGTNQFDIDKLLRSWYSLILKAKRKSIKHKRVVAIGAPSSFIQTSNIKKLLEGLLLNYQYECHEFNLYSAR